MSLTESETQALFEEHYSSVYRLALGLVGNPAEAEDVTQEVFLAVFSGLKKFRGEAAISTWIFRITTRIAYRHIARRRRYTGPTDEPLGADSAERGVVADEISAALSKLPLSLRTVLVMVSAHGLPHQTVAEILDIPVGTVWSRLHNARQKLDELLG